MVAIQGRRFAMDKSASFPRRAAPRLVCYDALGCVSGPLRAARTGANTRIMDTREKNRLYRAGLEAFNSSQFFEAHELWEDVWRDTPGPDKRYLQGLIQVAAAYHHYSRANLRGTKKLLQEGLLKLEDFPKTHGGFEIEPLRAAVREWLAVLGSGKTERMSPPRIATSKAHGRPGAATWLDDETGGEKT